MTNSIIIIIIIIKTSKQEFDSWQSDADFKNDTWLYWLVMLHRHYSQQFCHNLSIYVCTFVHRFLPLQTAGQLADACRSVSTNSVQPDRRCTQYISRWIVWVSPICLPLWPMPCCEDISSTEIWQCQAKRLSSCAHISLHLYVHVTTRSGTLIS